MEVGCEHLYEGIRKMKLYTKLSIMTILLITLTISISGLMIGRWEAKQSEASIERNLFNVATTISHSQLVKEGLLSKNSSEIQPFVKNLISVLADVEIITIADMEAVRYGHPNENRLGEKFVGGDEEAVIEDGSSYFSVATGTLGRSIRAFQPIYNNNQQIGFVMTGHMYDSVLEKQRQMEKKFAINSFWAVLIGSIGAFFISRSIKKSLLDLEPSEIVSLYRNQEAILSTAREGIIAIDKEERITLINQSAIDILGSSESAIAGRPILDVFPSTGLIRVMKSGIEEIGKERVFENTHILANRIPIYEDGKIVGAMATFLDRTEFVRKAEEVTGVNIILDALRANTHEFRNKLHVLLGLLQLGEHSKARKYIIDVETTTENLHRIMFDKIKNPTMSALLLGKYNRAQEEGVILIITEDSELESDCGISDDDLITVIGNLIENAIEAIVRSSLENCEIQVYIKNIDDEFVCQVSDNGPGMTQEMCKSVLKRGVTSKTGSSGIGLDLVSKVVKRYSGSIQLESEVNEGTEVTVVLKRGYSF